MRRERVQEGWKMKNEKTGNTKGVEDEDSATSVKENIEEKVTA